MGERNSALIINNASRCDQAAGHGDRDARYSYHCHRHNRQNEAKEHRSDADRMIVEGARVHSGDIKRNLVDVCLPIHYIRMRKKNVLNDVE